MEERENSEEFEVHIDTEEIESFLYKNLIARGFVPEEEEIQELADIVFDFLIEKMFISEDEEE